MLPYSAEASAATRGVVGTACAATPEGSDLRKHACGCAARNPTSCRSGGGRAGGGGVAGRGPPPGGVAGVQAVGPVRVRRPTDPADGSATGDRNRRGRGRHSTCGMCAHPARRVICVRPARRGQLDQPGRILTVVSTGSPMDSPHTHPQQAPAGPDVASPADRHSAARRPANSRRPSGQARCTAPATSGGQRPCAYDATSPSARRHVSGVLDVRRLVGGSANRYR